MISRYSSTDGIYIDKNLTDLVKLFACIMVALHHYSQNVISIGYSHNIILQAFSSQGGYLGVALFFFMSGYGLMISETKCHLKFVPYLKKRLSKILIPSALVTIIWFALQFGLNIIGGGKISFLDYLCKEWWHWGDDVMWFIKTLSLQYIFFWIYSYIRNSYSQFKFAAIIIIAVIAFLISYSVQIRHAISLPLFYLGVLIADYPERTRKVCSNLTFMFVALLFLLIVSYIGRHDAMVLHVLFNYIIVLIAVTFLAVYKIVIPATPAYIGQISFDVYLVHNKVIMSIRHFHGGFPIWSFVLATAISTIMFGLFRTLVSRKQK